MTVGLRGSIGCYCLGLLMKLLHTYNILDEKYKVILVAFFKNNKHVMIVDHWTKWSESYCTRFQLMSEILHQ